MTSLTDITDNHAHTSSCWWDHRAASWTCPAVPGADGTAGVDVRDMVVVHTALVRELRLAAPAVLRATASGDARLVRDVAAHLDLLATLLHHHHAGEDELLWPVLAPRLSDAQRALVEVAEAQHEAIDLALTEATEARGDWTDRPDHTNGERLAEAMRTLHALLVTHLEAEERDLLPLASAYLTQAEWDAIGEAGAAGVPKSALLLVFGMFAYEGDPLVLRQMLSAAPPPARVIVPRMAPRAYRRRARRVHATATP
jgi:hemerythrin-like domain-containing protein